MEFVEVSELYRVVPTDVVALEKHATVKEKTFIYLRGGHKIVVNKSVDEIQELIEAAGESQYLELNTVINNPALGEQNLQELFNNLFPDKSQAADEA